MALLRPITQQALNDVKYDVHSRDIHIEESERYSVAKKMFEEDKSILFFFIGVILMKKMADFIPIPSKTINI